MLSKRRLQRVGVAVLGGLVLAAGLVLWISPVPLGIILVPLGLLILASEFVWAQRLTVWVKTRTGRFGRLVTASEASARRRLPQRLKAHCHRELKATYQPDDARLSQGRCDDVTRLI